MRKVGADEISAHSGGQDECDPASMSIEPGAVIGGKYEVSRLLGSGGMAFVVAAKHLELDETVALKFLRSEFLSNRDLVACFVREARAAVKIKSEHVARVLDVGALPYGAPFIVMEYLDGRDLAALLREEGTPPVDGAAEYVMQACEALAAAHAIGIVHRDIKPENLFLVHRAEGTDLIKVLDFGISKLLRGSAVDRSGLNVTAAMGTPLYMSPEQIRGARDLDARADIWSLGCVLFELFTGHPPFAAPSIMMLAATILEQPTPLLRGQRVDLPAGLEAVVGRCLEKDPSRRFQDVAELAGALHPFAPTRTRLSVERCNQLLQSTRASDVPLDFVSVPPPSGRESSTAPTSPMADGTTDRTGDSRRDLELPPATTVTKRHSKVPLMAVLCLLLAAGGSVLGRARLAPWLTSAASLATTAIEGASDPPPTTSTPAIPEPVTTPSSLEAEPPATEVTGPPARVDTPIPAATADLARVPNAPEPPMVDTTAADAAIAAKPNAKPSVWRRRKHHSPSNTDSQQTQPSPPQETDVGY
jgi:serine/threonine protein kinase